MKWAQWDKTQSRELLGLFICVCIALCTIVAHNIAQNRPDNVPSYPPDNHHCSDNVCLREGRSIGHDDCRNDMRHRRINLIAKRDEIVAFHSVGRCEMTRRLSAGILQWMGNKTVNQKHWDSAYLSQGTSYQCSDPDSDPDPLSGSPPKFNRLFIGPLSIFPENFVHIRSEVFAQSC